MSWKLAKEIAQGAAIAALTLTICMLVAFQASAVERGGFVTEIGGGFKDFRTTSFLMRSECKKAVVTEPRDWPNNPRGIGGEYDVYGQFKVIPTGEWSCGGDNPVFVGWPIAWEFPNGVRIGYFHQSQWFDNEGELHFDCICASYTINWRRFRN